MKLLEKNCEGNRSGLGHINMSHLHELHFYLSLNFPFPGNLLNRTLGLLRKNCQSTLVVDSAGAAEGTALKETVETLVILLPLN